MFQEATGAVQVNLLVKAPRKPHQTWGLTQEILISRQTECPPLRVKERERANGRGATLTEWKPAG